MLQVIGPIARPQHLQRFNSVTTGGLGQLIQLFIYILIVVAGVYALFNFILAGYSFLSAGDDPKKVEAAWGKIWQTILGLALVAGAFVLAAIFGQILFGDPAFLLTPAIPTI